MELENPNTVLVIDSDCGAESKHWAKDLEDSRRGGQRPAFE